MLSINVAEDFAPTPGARYRTQGEFSGEEFRDEMLIPKVEEALEKKEKISIDLDGTYGYPPSFLEEAFGGLARFFPNEDLVSLFVFKCYDEPRLSQRIIDYIRKGNAR